MNKISLPQRLFIVAMVLLVSSCSSSRFYKDYNYSPREHAPDISGTEQASKEVLEANSNKNSTVQINHSETNTGNEPVSLENSGKINVVVQAFKEEMVAKEETTEQSSNRELMKKVTNRLVDEGQIDNLSSREVKKLDRIAAKMDKKLKKQGNEIDWRHNTPLELFFMIMAIAGLVLGILSVSFGWFIFIVFGGLWLYFKLVEDNK